MGKRVEFFSIFGFILHCMKSKIGNGDYSRKLFATQEKKLQFKKKVCAILEKEFIMLNLSMLISKYVHSPLDIERFTAKIIARIQGWMYPKVVFVNTVRN